MQITARATRVLKEVGEFIATVQHMCAVKEIVPMRIAIKVDMKREKDAVWCAAALREFFVQNKFDMLAHIEVGKLDVVSVDNTQIEKKSYKSQTEKSKRGRREKEKVVKETPPTVEFHILPLSSDILLHEHDVEHQRQAMQIEHSLLFDGTAAKSRSEWAADFGSQCRELCNDEGLRCRTDPRVWITLQALASNVHAHVANNKDPPVPAVSTVGPQLSPASEDADNSVDDEVLQQTRIIRIGLHNANRSSGQWCHTVSTLISVFERSDGLLAITDPRIVACLRVTQCASEEVNIAAQKNLDGSDNGDRPKNAKPIQLPSDIRIISEFKCLEEDPRVLELCKQLEQAAAQLHRPTNAPRCELYN